jgi:hypothetical protein
VVEARRIPRGEGIREPEAEGWEAGGGGGCGEYSCWTASRGRPVTALRFVPRLNLVGIRFPLCPAGTVTPTTR